MRQASRPQSRGLARQRARTSSGHDQPGRLSVLLPCGVKAAIHAPSRISELP
jgi:hypothetical protein